MSLRRATRAVAQPNSASFHPRGNQTGLTSDTLSSWLRDAHNYPEEMDFHLDAAEVESLTAYMLTLRDPGLRATEPLTAIERQAPVCRWRIPKK